jgi:NAD+ synthase (glutamine-hydrolysing)
MPRYCLAQINVTVGDLEENAARIAKVQEEAQAWKPDLVVFPELALAGYPPEDLLLKHGFLDRCAAAFSALVPTIRGRALIGHPWRDAEGKARNAASLVEDGLVRETYCKCLLPNYSVFDEKRYFVPGEAGLVFELAGESGSAQTVGVAICEDAWEDGGPARDEASAGAQVIACLSASPFHRGKHQLREETFARLCRQNRVWFLYCNLLGGQDELVFDGGSPRPGIRNPLPP